MSWNWKVEETEKLISLRGIEYSHLFDENRTIREGWDIIKENLNSELTIKQIRRKWSALCRRYMHIKTLIYNESDDSQKKITQSWQFFNLMDMALKNKFIIRASSPVNNSIKKNSQDLLSCNFVKQELYVNEDTIINEEMKKLCGQIFATSNLVLTFKCQLCHELFKNIKEFSDHLPLIHSRIICNNENDNNFNSDADDFKNVGIDCNESINELKSELNDNNLISENNDNNFNFETVLIENLKKHDIRNKIKLVNFNSEVLENNDEHNLYICEHCNLEFKRDILKNNHKCLGNLEIRNNDNIIQSKKLKEDENSFCNSNLFDPSISDEICLENLLNEDNDVLSTVNIDFDLKNKERISNKTKSLQCKSDLKTVCSESTFSCNICSSTFNCIEDKQIHEKKFHYNNFIQTSSKKENSDEEISKSEPLAKNSRGIYSCHICFSTFTRKDTLKRHEDRHINSGCFKCDYCPKRFNSIYDKARHHKTMHSNETLHSIAKSPYTNIISKFMCEFCRMLFKSKLDRDEHTKSCIGSHKSYECKICCKKFRSKKILEKHFERHQKLKPHQCHLCEKSFADVTNLKVHIHRHLGQKNHKCQYCEKRFVSSTEKKIHERSHRGEKPYLCTECGKSFVTSSHLTLHLKSHSGTKPYKCDQCDMSFYSSSLLRDHAVKHSGLRPFVCDVCNATFSRRKALRAHEKLHLDVGTYACKVCEKVFKQRAGLYSHMKSHNVAKENNEKLF